MLWAADGTEKEDDDDDDDDAACVGASSSASSAAMSSIGPADECLAVATMDPEERDDADVGSDDKATAASYFLFFLLR